MRSRRWGLAGALLVAAPVLVGIGYTVLGAVGVVGVGAEGFDLGRVARVLGERAVWSGLGWTLGVATAATALATAAAVAVAVTFRSTGPGDRVARALALVPLPVPQVVAAAAAVLLLGQSGYLARLAHGLGLVASPDRMPPLIYDRRGVGLVLTLAWKEAPFLSLIAFSLLAVRGAALEEVARSLGAPAGERFRRVTWPLLWRGMLPAIIAVFIVQAGAYEAAALLAPSDPLALPLLTLERYTDLDLGRRADAFVLGFVGMLLAAAAVGAHEWARRRSELLEP